MRLILQKILCYQLEFELAWPFILMRVSNDLKMILRVNKSDQKKYSKKFSRMIVVVVEKSSK